jgi:muramoyltetrapeptide carboxypeptidase LdcA involved in peptidoglycan recycling
MGYDSIILMANKYKVPPKLKKGDEIRVISPAYSLSLTSHERRKLAKSRLESLGLKVTFSANSEECDQFKSSSIKSRIDDLHQAFLDPNVKAIISADGGSNSNQLLKFIDYDLIRAHPKIFCGFSDITVLQNSILKKSELVTYSGSHYFGFGAEEWPTYDRNYFFKCLFQTEPIEISPAQPEGSYAVISPGDAEGIIIGGNLSTFTLLKGTEYMPALRNSVLFLEDEGMWGADTDVGFDRYLQSLIHLPDFSKVRGIVIGRFPEKSEMTLSKLKLIVESKQELAKIPVIAGVDFGHVTPTLTFPIGGLVSISSHASGRPTIHIPLH